MGNKHDRLRIRIGPVRPQYGPQQTNVMTVTDKRNLSAYKYLRQNGATQGTLLETQLAEAILLLLRVNAVHAQHSRFRFFANHNHGTGEGAI